MNNVKEILEYRQMSRKELASRLNTSEDAVYTWCRNLRQPPTTMIAKIANALDVDVESIIGKFDRNEVFRNDCEKEIFALLGNIRTEKLPLIIEMLNEMGGNK